MTPHDPWDDPTAKRWARHVLDEMVPKMKGSAAVCSIVPDGEGDVKFWVELGAMIMLNKPIVIVAFDDRQIPEKLRLVADEVVICPNGVNPAASKDLAAAINRLAARTPDRT